MLAGDLFIRSHQYKMPNIYYDPENGCDVKVFDNIALASEVLAKQIHEESVKNGDEVDNAWDEKPYREYLKNEARAILKERGESEIPFIQGHFLIKFEARANNANPNC